ncbi:ArsR/SmtB family transcription factor [Streptomyces sp. NPDC058525]|uniref:ArsR/SmtB family transcription factor n=1 Tax=unclassified Streptomyces TaxID=2593676 RepID=UPI00365DB065
MTLRIHFTAEDLARVRLTSLGPLAETELSLWNVQTRERRAMFGAWRTRTGPRIEADGRDLARFLARPTGGMVDLFTATGPADSIDEAIELVRAMPHQRLREEFTFAACMSRRRAPWLGRVLERDREAGARLTRALRHCHDVAVAPYGEQVRRLVETELTLCGRLLAQGGLAGLFGRLGPMLVWNAPTLEVPGYRPWLQSSDVRMEGREFLIAPAVFCGSVPQLFARRHGSQLLLIYPVLRDLATAGALWAAPGPGRRPGSGLPQPLIALLGRTRATVLDVIAAHPACTTTQLARHAHVSLASASEHATVLREAGLTGIDRNGKHVRHSLTPAGHTLLGTAAGIGG